MNFKSFLNEGGNVKIGDEEAQLIDLTKISRKKLVNSVTKFLIELNEIFKSKHKTTLFPSLSFSGSSQHLFNEKIKDEDFVKFKPRVGDIDVQIPDEKFQRLIRLLDEYKNKKIKGFEYLGRSKVDTQINGVFKTKFGNIQIDFEPVYFNKNKPTEFSSFAHSSDWNDIKAGIKGVFHKFLLQALISEKEHKNIILLTKTGKRSRKQIPRFNVNTFSVDKGMREKFVPYLDEHGKQVHIDGKPAFRELETKEANYIRDIDLIFYSIYGYYPNKQDKQKFKSFLGNLELMKKSLDKNKIKSIFDGFIDKLWGNGANKISNDLSIDVRVKNTALNKFKEVFPYLNYNEKMKEQYYEKQFN